MGLLYNWCAAVDTFKTGADEVSNGKHIENYDKWTTVLNLENGNRRGICPKGWHLPTAEEWDAMLDAAGVTQRTGSSGAALGTGAGKLVTGCYWNPKNNVATSPGDYSYADRNSSGFSAVPGGTFNNNYYWYPTLAEYAYFWTSSQPSNNAQAIRYSINYQWAGVKQDSNLKYLGGSVRCVRDAE